MQEKININRGLDFLRGIIAFLVVLQHSFILTDAHLPRLRMMGLINNCALELFFIISGYLIACQFQRYNNIETNTEKFNFLKKYFRNRYLKTLPPYYALILLGMLLASFGVYHAYDYSFSFFVFGQSFFNSQFYFLPHSYSLVIEEWFYIVFPLLLILMREVLKMKNGFLFSSLLILFFVLLYRIINHWNGIHNWDGEVRKALFSRLDAPFYGVLLYYLNQKARFTFEKFKLQFLILGLILFLLSTYILKVCHITFFNNVFYFTIYPISLIFIVNYSIYFNIPIKLHETLRIMRVQSYSLYLVHLPVLYILANYLVAQSKLEAIAYLIFGIICSYLMAIIFYRLFEKPFQKFKV